MHRLLTSTNTKIPWIIAHRGYCADYPENTLVAFQAAADAGAAMIELDVTFSRDRRLVVIHDDTLDRTTNGKGPVQAHTMDAMKKLDAGSWFHPRFADQRLPELAEVLDLVKGRLLVNIEIKSNAYEPGHPPDAIERQVVELVQQMNLQDSILISSFNLNILQQIAAMQAAPAIAFISETPADRGTVATCTRLKAFSWHPDHRVVTAPQVDMMHAAGIKVLPWTVESRQAYLKMMDMGVDGVITNDPATARRWSRWHKIA